MRSTSVLSITTVVAMIAAVYVGCGGDDKHIRPDGSGGEGGDASSSSKAASGSQSSTAVVGPVASSAAGGADHPFIACNPPEKAPSEGACFVIGGSAGGTGGAGGGGGVGGGGGAGGTPDCTGLLPATTECNTCTLNMCCPQLDACDKDPNCLDCYTGKAPPNPNGCESPESKKAIDAVIACSNTKCVQQCNPPPPQSTCNPVTNEGCDTDAEEACDITLVEGLYVFRCRPGDNTEEICTDCDYGQGPYCKIGMTCLPAIKTAGTCARYCCDDGDCGEGVCNKNKIPNLGVGVCVKKEE